MSSPTEMRVFERVVERGSFADAAADVGLSASAVSKLITRLELRLGVRLLNRTTRSLALTAEGEVYLGRVREILSAIEAAEFEITSASVAPRGHLRVHTLPVLATNYLASALPEFLARYPQITIGFQITNRAVDLIEENIDIALLAGSLSDSSLIARKITNLRRIVCASPEYLARHGRPVQTHDLLEHSCLILDRAPGGGSWPFRIDGKPISINVKGPIRADNADMLLQLSIEGVGIVRLGEIAVAEALHRGQLLPLLEDFEDDIDNYPLWAVLPPGKLIPPKVKVFLDFLLERLGARPWRSRITAPASYPL